MPSWNLHGLPIGIGWLIALVVLILILIIAVADVHLTRDWILGLFAALAVARLLP
jgi:hypothetical protein